LKGGKRMCFEWDKRYFRELEEKKAKEKLDEMLRKAEEAAQQSGARDSETIPPGVQTEKSLH
jgi:16S rRNA U1498 N3-methylase RsmE